MAEKSNSDVKLHLGCGKRFLPGWIHVDAQSQPHLDYQADISDLRKIFADESVDEIYTCHVFEHFPRAQVPSVLLEWSRMLKPTGKLRISTPDFQQVVEMYQQSKDNLYKNLLGLLNGGQRNQYDYHQMTYDFHNLEKLLTICGFKNVQRYDPHDFLPDGYDDYSLAYLPPFDKNGTLMSLNIVCEKERYITDIDNEPLIKSLCGPAPFSTYQLKD